MELHTTLEEEAVVVLDHLFQVLDVTQVKKQLQFKVIQLPMVQLEQDKQLLVLREALEVFQLLHAQHRQEGAVEEVG